MTSTTEHRVTGRSLSARNGHRTFEAFCRVCGSVGSAETREQAAAMPCPAASPEPAGLPVDAPREIPADEVEVGDEIHHPGGDEDDSDFAEADTWEVLQVKTRPNGDRTFECVGDGGRLVRWLYYAPTDLVSVALNAESQAAMGHDLAEPMVAR